MVRNGVGAVIQANPRSTETVQTSQPSTSWLTCIFPLPNEDYHRVSRELTRGDKFPYDVLDAEFWTSSMKTARSAGNMSGTNLPDFEDGGMRVSKFRMLE